jgi:hypothetical protein
MCQPAPALLQLLKILLLLVVLHNMSSSCRSYSLLQTPCDNVFATERMIYSFYEKLLVFRYEPAAKLPN